MRKPVNCSRIVTLALMGALFAVLSPNQASAATTIARVAASPTDGIQEALAAGEYRLTPGETYHLDQGITVPRGVTKIDGAGAKLVLGPGAGEAILFRSSASNLKLINLSIDMSASPNAKAIRGFANAKQDAGYPDEVMRGVTIEAAFITGLGPQGRGIEVVAREGHAENLTFKDNVIAFANAAEASPQRGGTGIAVVTTPPNSEQGQWDSFTKTNTIVRGAFYAKGFTITGNRVHGGYYGIGFEGVTDSRITGNRLTWNKRNISLQAGSNGNLVANNHLGEAASSSIHVAYQSDHNTIADNIVTTRRACGEGLLQAYTGSQHNQFLRNQVYAINQSCPTGEATGPMWALHAATGANGTVFDANLVSAHVSRAVMLSESIWDGDSVGSGDSAHSRSYMTDPIKGKPHNENDKVGYHGGRGNLTGVAYTGNILHNPAGRPLLHLGAEVTKENAGSVGNISGFRVNGNAVLGRTDWSVHAGYLQDVGRASVDLTGVTLPAPVTPPWMGPFVRSGEVYAATEHTLAAEQQHLWLLGAAATATGNAGHNQLRGNPAANTLNGAAGDDTLTGGTGADRLIGGPGADRYVLETDVAQGGDVDYIEFEAGDKLVLPQIHFGVLTGDWFTPIGQRRTAQSRVHQSGTGLYHDADGPGSLLSPVRFATLPEGVRLNQTDFAAG